MNLFSQPTAWQLIPSMPIYQPSPPVNLFQLQMQQLVALRYNATLMPLGNGAFVTVQVPPLILQLDQYQGLSADPHRDRVYQPERGRCKTAAPIHNQFSRTSFSTITNDHCTISHHSWVKDINNARNGSAGGPPSSRMSATPNQKSQSRGVQNRSKQVSTIRSQRKCDDLLQYVVANKGAQSGRPRRRYRRGVQPTANIPILTSVPVLSSSTIYAMGDEATEAKNP